MSDFVEGDRDYTRVHTPCGREIKVNKQVHYIVIGFRMCAGVQAQSFLTLCNAMDCSPPSSSIHGIIQARTLESVAISFSRHLD